MNRKTEAFLMLALFVASMVVAAVFWSLLPVEFRENQSSDYLLVYEPVARSIAAGRGVTLDGEPATRYPPGFSLLLAGTFRAGASLNVTDEVALMAFRLLCVGLSAVLVYALARLVWPPGLALLPALAWLTYPFGLWLAKQPNSEVPFIPVLFAALYLLWRAALRGARGSHACALYLAAGIMAGAAMLIRPAALGLSAVMAVIVVIFAARATPLPARVAYGALIVLGSILAVAPWEAAVYARTGEIVPLSSGGAVTIQDGLTFLAVPKEYRREVPVPEDVAALMWRFHERRPEMAGTGGAIRVMLDEAGRSPAAFGRFMLIKAARSWYGIDSRIFEGPVLLLQVVYMALVLWGSVHAWRHGGALWRLIAGNWLVVLYFWAMTLLVVPLLRYMTPVMGLLFVALPGVYLSFAARRSRPADLSRSVPSDY